MSKAIVVSDVTFIAAAQDHRRRGLLGWTSFVINRALKLSSVSVRRTADHRLVLSFPARIDGAGRRRFYFRPLNDRTRKAIEEQVFDQLDLTESPKR